MHDVNIQREGLLEIRNYLEGDYREEIARDISAGMSRPQKTIPSKYFYDTYGCQLFERICCTPEYYLTKTELSILDHAAEVIMAFFADDGGDLVELGSGSNRKIKRLLDAVGEEDLNKIRYVPVDVSETSLKEASRGLRRQYRNLRILGVVADFTRHLEMLPSGRKLIILFGSTLGNLTEPRAITFLKKMSDIMTPEDSLLLGLDMLKKASILEAAYNDGMGITRKFNLNILSHINRELNADFNLGDFDHRAFFDSTKGRVEMHLEAKRAVRVRISDLALSVDFKKGETIHTEVCNKFSREKASRIFGKANLSETAWLTDPKGWFSLVALKTANGAGGMKDEG